MSWTSRVAGAVLATAVLVPAAPVILPVAPATADDDATPVVRLADPRITESSGLAASLRHPGVVWTHNDSGDSARLFAVDLASGATVATVRLAGAPARDWEALAAVREADGTPVLWVGDIGDNAGGWPFVRLYRVEEPAELSDGEVPWTAYRVRYEDGPRDAEALLADPRTGRLSIVSKQVSGAGVYLLPERLAPTPETNVARWTAVAPPAVTDGAYAPDGGTVALVSYLGGWLLDAGGGTATPVGLPARPQGESVTWTPDGGALLVGTEGGASGIWRVPLRAAPTATAAASSPTSGPGENVVSDERGGNVPYWTVGALSAAGAAGLLAVVAAVRAVLRRRSRRRAG